MSMRGTMFVLLLTVVALLSSPAAGDTLGITCKDHPVYKGGMKGILIRSWTFRKNGDRMNWPTSAYFTRHTQQQYAPMDDEANTKYKGLDYFVTHTTGNGKHKDFVTLNFQRPAKVFILVHAWKGSVRPSMRGWKREGWVKLVKGERRTMVGLGTRKRSMGATSRAYAFSKVGTSVTVGTRSFVKSQLKGLNARGSWTLLIGEEDGSPVAKTRAPGGMKITANEYCPPELHEKWVTDANDKQDKLLRGKKFRTWHPQLDSCYGCYYDHEHGSNAKKIMGYAPKYGYTALKNFNQDESHKGFKDIVLDGKNYYIYYGIHAHMGKADRFFTRFHTKVIAAVNKKTKKLELELAFKADYGIREVRLRNGKRKPVNKDDEKLAAELGFGDHCEPMKKRLVNVIDPKKLDRSLSFREGGKFMHGQYEQWVFAGQPLCGKTKKHREPTVDFRNMALALKNLKGKATTVLGRTRNGMFVPQTSENRQFRSRYFVLAEEFCNFPLAGIHGAPKKGKFYTNPYGTAIYSSPGKHRIAQYVKPGFKYSVEGDYEAEDTWDGLYIRGGHGSIKDLNCLDYKEN